MQVQAYSFWTNICEGFCIIWYAHGLVRTGNTTQ